MFFRHSHLVFDGSLGLLEYFTFFTVVCFEDNVKGDVSLIKFAVRS